MLELYHHGSSACAAKVRFALAEKGLDWTGHYVDLLKGEQFAPAYLALNPKGVVPLLVHDGFVLAESTVICEYLDEVFAERPIYPADPKLRAKVRLWTKAVDEELHPACSALTYVVSHRHSIIRNGLGSYEDFVAQGASEGASARQLKWQWLTQGIEAPGASDKVRLYDAYLRKMEEALAGGDWLVGEAFSMADIAMAPYVNRCAALAMEGLWTGGRLPRVEAWFARVKARPTFAPAFEQWLPDALRDEMRGNGEKSWPAIRALLGV